MLQQVLQPFSFPIQAPATPAEAMRGISAGSHGQGRSLEGTRSPHSLKGDWAVGVAPYQCGS